MRKVLARRTTMLARGERPHHARRLVSLFVLVSALALIATVTVGSGAAPAVLGHGTFDATSLDQFSVSPGSYHWMRLADGASIAGKVQCVYQNGTFAAVGGTITDATAPIPATVVGEHFLVYFRGQETTNPNIDPENDPDVSGLLLPGFPAAGHCPSSAPTDAPFRQVFPPGFIKYGGA
jgi:hypothetical protein